ncbi:hypothetical protein PQR53_22280 [Paraburkholderia fungorum]|jgi:hypothetical protein|uniref:hypothetical protein n=1 Tax=Paraburkholderia fungorum TaxID=134537 RepID=UPI0038B80FDB
MRVEAASIRATKSSGYSGVEANGLTVQLFHPAFKLGNILRSCELFIRVGLLGIFQPPVEAF